MNSALAGLLTGVAGGASKYGQVRDEQRKYDLSEKKSAQDQMRKESFARFQYGLQDSGMRTTQGRVVSNTQADQGGNFEGRGDRLARIKSAEDEKNRANTAADKAVLLEEKDAKKAILLDTKQKREDKIREDNIKRQEAALKTKTDRTDKKAETKIEKDFVINGKRTIRENIKNTAYHGAPFTAKIEGAMEFYGTNRDNPMVEMIPEVMSASRVYKNSMAFIEVYNANESFFDKNKLKETKAAMKTKGMSKLDIDQAVKYLEGKDALE